MMVSMALPVATSAFSWGRRQLSRVGQAGPLATPVMASYGPQLGYGLRQPTPAMAHHRGSGPGYGTSPGFGPGSVQVV